MSAMKLYTRSGDDGTTGLFSGGRVSKDAARIAAIGDVDEFNCAVGLARCVCDDQTLAPILMQLQNRLFSLGADLASKAGPDAQVKSRIIADDVVWAETTIDALCAPLPPLQKFILPGGSELAARLHMARAVCRRAERICITLARQENIEAPLLIFLNRCSDLLFAMARRANQLQDVNDVTWEEE